MVYCGLMENPENAKPSINLRILVGLTAARLFSRRRFIISGHCSDGINDASEVSVCHNRNRFLNVTEFTMHVVLGSLPATSGFVSDQFKRVETIHSAEAGLREA